MTPRKLISFALFTLNLLPIYGITLASAEGNYGNFVFMCYSILGLTLMGWLVGDY